MAAFTGVPVPCPVCGLEVVLPILSHTARQGRLDIHASFGPMADHIESVHPDDDDLCDQPYQEH